MGGGGLWVFFLKNISVSKFDGKKLLSLIWADKNILKALYAWQNSAANRTIVPPFKLNWWSPIVFENLHSPFPDNELRMFLSLSSHNVLNPSSLEDIIFLKIHSPVLLLIVNKILIYWYIGFIIFFIRISIQKVGRGSLLNWNPCRSFLLWWITLRESRRQCTDLEIMDYRPTFMHISNIFTIAPWSMCTYNKYSLCPFIQINTFCV